MFQQKQDRKDKDTKEGDMKFLRNVDKILIYDSVTFKNIFSFKFLIDYQRLSYMSKNKTIFATGRGGL
jgi:hypothetical protein